MFEIIAKSGFHYTMSSVFQLLLFAGIVRGIALILMKLCFLSREKAKKKIIIVL